MQRCHWRFGRMRDFTSSLLLPVAVLLHYAAVLRRCHALLPTPQPRHRGCHHRGQVTVAYTSSKNNHEWPALFAAAPTVAIAEKESAAPSIAVDDVRQQQLVREVGSAFAQKLLELEDYRRENGHCLVPKRYEGNPSLGNWVNKQRQNYRKLLNGEKTSMNERRVRALNELGFVWNTTAIPLKSAYNDNAWQRMYNQLSDFHATNGHCRVPSTSPLGQWVVRQRFLYRQYPLGQAKPSLTNERINLLNQLSFQWSTRSEQMWDTRMNELRQFKRQHGHAMVPRKYDPNPQLSSWVATQRKNYNRRQAGKTSPLSLARIKELEEMGFVWSYWDHNFFPEQ